MPVPDFPPSRRFAALAPGCLVLTALAPAATSQIVVDPSSRASVVSVYSTIYLPAIANASPGWTGSVATCTPGTISQQFVDDTLAVLNTLRGLAGLNSDIAVDALFSADAQQGALMLEASGVVSHNLPMTAPCWTAAGNAALFGSVLVAGAIGPNSVELLMLDAGTPDLGHRRFLLYPPQIEVGVGATSSRFALYVLDAGLFGPRPASPAWVAWPPAGFVPYRMLNDTWSFSASGANFSSAQVVVTKDGNPQPLTTRVPVQYGDPAFTWTLAPGAVTRSAGMSDTTYSVTVSGITGLSQSSFTYEVTVFDPQTVPVELLSFTIE